MNSPIISTPLIAEPTNPNAYFLFVVIGSSMDISLAEIAGEINELYLFCFHGWLGGFYGTPINRLGRYPAMEVL